jgi:hypothetical protein
MTIWIIQLVKSKQIKVYYYQRQHDLGGKMNILCGKKIPVDAFCKKLYTVNAWWQNFVFKNRFGFTLKLLNILIEIVCLPFLELFVVNFRNIKLRIWNWSAESLDLGYTAEMFRLAGGKR